MRRGLARIPFAVAVAGSAHLLYWTATSRPLWVDEEMLLLNVRDRGFLELAGPLWLDQSAPLGWLALERFMLLILGRSEPAVRLLTVAIGIAALLTAAWIGRRWMSVVGATVFVTLCATGQWFVFFTLELKHYSADLLGAMLIPALAAWSIEHDGESPDVRPRIMRWWIVAAIAQWFSNGALFVTPFCVLVVAVVLARRRNGRAIGAMIVGGSLWAASFAANYVLVLRHAAANAYLREYWAFAFPPVAEGLAATLMWIGHWFEGFAVKPVGSGFPALFWLAFTIGVGYAVAIRRAHGAMIATVPLAGLALALLHVVPPFERLALWIVPSMYAGIGYAADAAIGLLRFAAGRARPLIVAASAATVVVTFAVSGNIVRRGVRDVAARPSHSNYGLDDRRSIRFLLENHRPGDAIVTTHFGLAALWWYGKIALTSADGGGRLADGSPIFEIGYLPPEECHAAKSRIAAALAGHERMAIYLAFRTNVLPAGFDELVLHQAGKRWALDTYKEYAELSRVAIYDLNRAPGVGTRGALSESQSAMPDGCFGVQSAKRW